MHTQSPKALVTQFPILDSPTPPKEIHSNTTHTSQYRQTTSTHQQQTRAPHIPHSSHSTSQTTHARHHTLIHRSSNNFMRQHVKTTSKRPQNNSTPNHCRLRATLDTPAQPNTATKQRHPRDIKAQWQHTHTRHTQQNTYQSSMVPNTCSTRGPTAT